MNRKLTRFSFFFIASFFASWCMGQNDSLHLEPKALGIDDIVSTVDLQGEDIKMISGNRFPMAAADLPFSTHVITAEEIRLNGYETLVDALKMAPGIRVSQPGSAIEGETFLMRGLLGNTYTKILIDDVPIKPGFVASMPIGAQLPIKEAERIEIIYGSGAALYGADASAGVINIVTKKSEKPVFMQADLSVGGGRYSSLNLSFGGRLGRDRNIFKYYVYASSVIYDERDIFYDQDYNFNPTNYPSLTLNDTSYVNYRNYAGRSSTSPTLTNTPHLSRRVGGYLKYKGMTISLETMYRRDHSSLGLNPAAVSYRDPLTYTGETIIRVNVNFFKNKTNRNRKTDITFIRYDIDERSSILNVRNQLTNEFGKAALAAARRDHPDSVAFYQNQFFNQNYQRYIDGPRYRFGWSQELRIEHVRNYRLLKLMTLTVGGNVKILAGFPFTEHLSRPPSENGDLLVTDPIGFSFDPITYVILPDFKFLAESNLFGQIFYNGKRLNLTGGINQIDYVTEGEMDGTTNSVSTRSGRLSALFKLGEWANIRSSWGRSFRIPNEYFLANTYFINSDNPNFLSRQFFPLNPEVTTSWEGGIRFKNNDRIGSEFTLFTNETTDLISYAPTVGGFQSDTTIYRSVIGYRNIENSKIRFTGGQITLFFNFFTKDKSFAKGHYSYGWTNAEAINVSETNQDIPRAEGRLHQFRLQIHPTTNSTFIFDYVRVNGLGRQAGPDGKDKYGTLDVTARYAFTERFDAYARVVNMFDMKYSGIPASRTANDLLYNPQNGLFLRLGMTYFIE